jgi:hypothetical protein
VGYQTISVLQPAKQSDIYVPIKMDNMTQVKFWTGHANACLGSAKSGAN